MTCIVGLEYKNKIFMGGDSAAVSGLDMNITNLSKVFRRWSGGKEDLQLDEFLIGYTSSFRMGQLLQYELIIPENKEKLLDLHYLITKVVPAIRDCLKVGGFTKVENNVEESGEFLIGYNGKIYSIQSDFQVNQYNESYSAIGCGAKYALGALAAMRISNPIYCIGKALKIAEHFNAGVRGPFNILEL